MSHFWLISQKHPGCPPLIITLLLDCFLNLHLKEKGKMCFSLLFILLVNIFTFLILHFDILEHLFSTSIQLNYLQRLLIRNLGAMDWYCLLAWYATQSTFYCFSKLLLEHTSTMEIQITNTHIKKVCTRWFLCMTSCAGLNI